MKTSGSSPYLFLLLCGVWSQNSLETNWTPAIMILFMFCGVIVSLMADAAITKCINNIQLSLTVNPEEANENPNNGSS